MAAAQQGGGGRATKTAAPMVARGHGCSSATAAFHLLGLTLRVRSRTAGGGRRRGTIFIGPGQGIGKRRVVHLGERMRGRGHSRRAAAGGRGRRGGTAGFDFFTLFFLAIRDHDTAGGIDNLVAVLDGKVGLGLDVFLFDEGQHDRRGRHGRFNNHLERTRGFARFLTRAELGSSGCPGERSVSNRDAGGGRLVKRGAANAARVGCQRGAGATGIDTGMIDSLGEDVT
uniref:ORF9 n=1 Tax=Human cytomegalovirus TaxID=10359 RepID=Q6RXC4_HCMV|nr:ORF9 [Human betaherpesvirus 5]